MNIIFYVPGMAFNGATIAQGQSLGGSESSGYYLAREMATRGHTVTVFTNGAPGIWEDVRYLNIGQQTQEHPHGVDFERYAESTPSDVLICQRAPGVFNKSFASKINLWWTHDLGLKRTQPHLNSQLWNVDRVLVVSEYHKEQVSGVYSIPDESITVIPNGIDHAFYTDPVPAEVKQLGKWLMYTSRPERGLGHLVEVGGIMERLYKLDPDITLKVAGYENTTPQMRPLYEHLWNRCQVLPNVELLGPLSKRELAQHQQSAWLHVYPTTFEEVSCITAMEQSAAGTPFLASMVAALPETLKDGGVQWVTHATNGQPDLDGFVRAIISQRDHPAKWDSLHKKALLKSASYGYDIPADNLESAIDEIFAEKVSNNDRLFRHFIRHTDVQAARKVAKTDDQLVEMKRDYVFAESYENIAAHYREISKFESDRNLTFGLGHPNFGSGNMRFSAMCTELAQIPEGSSVLDWGCSLGQHVYAYAKRFPTLSFTGVDIAEKTIERGRDFLSKNPTPNLVLFTVDEFKQEEIPGFDVVLCSEVLEHTIDPWPFINLLELCACDRGKVIITTPWGPWGDTSNPDDHFLEHLHHFEYQDIFEMVGHKSEFKCASIPGGMTRWQAPQGHFHFSWRVKHGDNSTGKINYARKIKHQAPRETLSVCMIVGQDGATLAKTLESIQTIADEIIIGIDCGDDGQSLPSDEGRAAEIAEEFGAEAFPIVTPIKQGFAAARNATIEKATSDWIMWIDDDEVWQWPERLHKYLRPNLYDAYAVYQHHYSVEPASVIKTDMPCRIFRNNRGMKFFGHVHEHPEKKINDGPGQVYLLPDVAISHNGYATEEIRRKRFERNFPLMLRDREDFPKRWLGKMLWVRDVAHVNRYNMERGIGFSPENRAQSEQALAIWREIVTEGPGRMAVDSIQYYSEIVKTLTGGGIEFTIGMGASAGGIGNSNGKPPDPIRGIFFNTDDIRLLISAMTKDVISVYNERYF